MIRGEVTSERWAGAAGLGFIALTVAAEAIARKPNEPTTRDQQLLDFYSDSGNQYRLYAAAVIAVAAGMLFLWFLVGLREGLLAAEGVNAAAMTIGFAAAIVFVAVWVVGYAVSTAIPATLIYDDNFELREAGFARPVLVLGNHWLSGAAASVSALVVAASSVASRRTEVFPSWLVWGGYVIAAILLVSMPTFAGITVLALGLWTLVVSVRLLRSQP
jgi:hypothetical protein